MACLGESTKASLTGAARSFEHGVEWVDITAVLKGAASGMPQSVQVADMCTELALGQLVREEHFSLYDAMTAIELMDPKMDSGMDFAQSSKRIGSLNEAVKVM